MLKEKFKIFVCFFGMVCVLGVTGCSNSDTVVSQPPSSSTNTPIASTSTDSGVSPSVTTTKTTTDSSSEITASGAITGLDGETTTRTSTSATTEISAKPKLSMEDYFKQSFEADKKNQNAQTWSDYWEWVNKFYDGNFMADGWRKQTEEALKGTSGEAREKLSQKLDDLGRKICAEWAKDNTVRKLTSDDLKVLGQKMKTGIKNPNGDVSKSLLFVDQIISEVEAKVGR